MRSPRLPLVASTVVKGRRALIAVTTVAFFAPSVSALAIRSEPKPNKHAIEETSEGRTVYRVPSGSMEPTLKIGSRVVVVPGTPRVGAIVVFEPPKGSEQEECGPKPHIVKLGGAACSAPVPKPLSVKFIKRIVAGPGDRIYIKHGHVYREPAGTSRFTREPESYIKPCAVSPECDFPTPIKIPRGHWFMLGDNRGESDDSRFWGPVPTSWIIGVAQPVTATREVTLIAPGAPPAEPAAGLSAAAQQVFAIGLARAKESGDPDPTSMEYATGTLQRASEVLGRVESFYPPGEGPGQASSTVNLIVMVGHFFHTGSLPPCVLDPTGTVLTLIADQQSGFVSTVGLGDSPPTLSQLGPVTRLDAESAPPPTVTRTESEPACDRLERAP
jgi:signal peptidase I